MVKIGSPLFILREECAKDLMAVLDRLAQIGFEGIEFLGLFGHNPADIKKHLDSCGLIAVGGHVAFDEFVARLDKVIDEHKVIGCDYITVGGLGADRFTGGKDSLQTLAALEKLGEAVNRAGMTLLYHNHAEELRGTVGGKTILEHIADDTDPGLISLEPDLGWMRIGGADPAYYLRKYKNRCPVVHFKDFMPIQGGEGFVFSPTGYGIMNNAELYAMTLGFDVRPEWYIMDHDCAYDRDIYDDLAMSLAYFKNLTRVINTNPRQSTV